MLVIMTLGVLAKKLIDSGHCGPGVGLAFLLGPLLLFGFVGCYHHLEWGQIGMFGCQCYGGISITGGVETGSSGSWGCVETIDYGTRRSYYWWWVDLWGLSWSFVVWRPGSVVASCGVWSGL